MLLFAGAWHLALPSCKSRSFAGWFAFFVFHWPQRKFPRYGVSWIWGCYAGVYPRMLSVVHYPQIIYAVVRMDAVDMVYLFALFQGFDKRISNKPMD
jgi:hypothetical protein